MLQDYDRKVDQLANGVTPQAEVWLGRRPTELEIVKVRMPTYNPRDSM